MKSRPVILLVGGTDPSGGAGLAADLKSTAALGGHGCIAVTATTVQNSGRVQSWLPVPADEITRQMEITCEDGIPDAVKSGMLGSSQAVEAVASVLNNSLAEVPYILDPVMVAGSGDGLAKEGLAKHLTKHLLPRASLVTPNLDEAEAFTGKTVRSEAEMEDAAKEIMDMGASGVLLKGGHLEGKPSDLLLTPDIMKWFPGERIIPGKVHGTGCTLASSCAVLMGAGYPVEAAVQKALQYLRTAIAGSWDRRMGTILGHFPPMGPLPELQNRSSFYRVPRFCPSCAGELADASPHPLCTRCGLVFYRNPLPAVVLVLRNSSGQILLARRAAPPAKGELSLPGGFIDPGESSAEAAVRELTEETTLTGAEPVLAGTERDLTDYGSVVLFVYHMENWKGTPTASDDVSELLWEDLDRVPQLAFKAHDRIINMLRRKDS